MQGITITELGNPNNEFSLVAEPAGQSGTQSRLKALTIPQALERWLREPLVHFLLIGAALFAIYSYLHRGRMGIESPHQIVASLDELRQIDLYSSRNGTASRP